MVCKFWLQISKAEQLKRFEAREKTSFKRFKITKDDWRNRKKWGAYEQAIADMVDRTSTEIAPWTLVEAEDKRYARVKIVKTIVNRLEEALGLTMHAGRQRHHLMPRRSGWPAATRRRSGLPSSPGRVSRCAASGSRSATAISGTSTGWTHRGPGRAARRVVPRSRRQCPIALRRVDVRPALHAGPARRGTALPRLRRRAQPLAARLPLG